MGVRKKSVLELAIRQTGSRAARAAAEKVAAKEGTSAGIIKACSAPSLTTTIGLLGA